ncbi:MAG: hypothetical protein HQL91_04365 [Magnetococcales bacterium]|nr:hypothetical protein [Magnetococcales bacterium]
MRNTTKSLVLLLAGLSASPALAGTKVGDLEINGNMTLASDYVWRGVSQSARGPAVQGGITVNHASGLYVGVWGSSIDFENVSTASLEMDLFAGFTYEFPVGLKLDAGILHYDYPGADHALELDFEEYYLGASYKYQALGMSGKYSYSPDYTGSPNSKSAYYLEGALTYDLPEGFVAAAHYGHTGGDFYNALKPDNYNDYSVGVSKEVLGFVVDLSFYGTDSDGRTLFPRNADDRVVFKVTKNF